MAYSLKEMVEDLQSQMDASVKLTTYLQKQNEELANQLATRVSTTQATDSTKSSADFFELKEEVNVLTRKLDKTTRERDQYREALGELEGGEAVGHLITDVYQKLNAVTDERDRAVKELKAMKSGQGGGGSNVVEYSKKSTRTVKSSSR